MRICTKEECIALLQEKQAELAGQGIRRYPQRGDFSAEEVMAVKNNLGPWPRALEAAGLKEAREKTRQEINREKRARAEKRLKTARREAKKAELAAGPKQKEDGESRLKALMQKVQPPQRTAIKEARLRQEHLAKPLGSLGRLEELSVRLAGMTGRVKNELDKKCLLVFCADNGVIEEGVSIPPQEVTLRQAENLAKGLTGAGVLAGEAGCEVRVYDVGINGTVREERVIDRKIAFGTANFAKGRAMSREQAIQAILIGCEAAGQAKEDGVCICGVGELGIGNTTTSSAVLAALTGAAPETVTGRGGGLTDEGLARKVEVIRGALANFFTGQEDTVDILAKFGGFDLAAMTGAFLGGAACRMPMVIDGFISVVAALCAVRLAPDVRHYLIASHQSAEQGYRLAAAELGIRPLFDLEMRLGEGSGCPIAMKIADSACAVMNRMASFEEAGINDGYLAEMRAERAVTEEKA